MAKKPISADSHITEPPNCYKDYIDPKFRDVAPRIVSDDRLGDIYKIDGLDTPIPLSLVAAAGKDPSELGARGGVFERHPKLKLVCVEADAGWAPHCMYRMDHAYKRHRYWLMWANDFPHSDATWPWSQEMLAEHSAGLTDAERDRILHDNVAELYGLQVA